MTRISSQSRGAGSTHRSDRIGSLSFDSPYQPAALASRTARRLHHQHDCDCSNLRASSERHPETLQHRRVLFAVEMVLLLQRLDKLEDPRSAHDAESKSALRTPKFKKPLRAHFECTSPLAPVKLLFQQTPNPPPAPGLSVPIPRRFNDPAIQRFNDSTIQRSTIPRFNDSTIQRFNDSLGRALSFPLAHG